MRWEPFNLKFLFNFGFTNICKVLMFYAKSMQADISCIKWQHRQQHLLILEFQLFAQLSVDQYSKYNYFSRFQMFHNIFYRFQMFHNICLLQPVGQSSDGRSMYKQQGGDNFLFFLVKVTFPCHRTEITNYKITNAFLTII